MLTKRDALKSLTLLDFAKDFAFHKETDGAGGNQLYSELVAKRSGVSKQIGRVETTVLIGVFALGGGTGAGAAKAVFEEFKSTKSRQGCYTLGIGILPDWRFIDAKARAGRALVNYHRLPVSRRSDSLILFSNQAAQTALRLAAMAGNSASSGIHVNELVNDYVFRIVATVLLFKGKKLETVENKQYDFQDFRRSFQSVRCIGLSSAVKPQGGGVNLWDLVTSAIGPQRFLPADAGNPNRLEGLSIAVTTAEDETKLLEFTKKMSSSFETIRNGFRRDHVESFMTQSPTVVEAIQSVAKLSLFYRTTKEATFFVFGNTEAFSSLTESIQVVARRTQFLFTQLTGTEISISFCAYKVPMLNECCVMFIPKDPLFAETTVNALEFVHQAFAKDELDASDLNRSVWQYMRDNVKRQSASARTAVSIAFKQEFQKKLEAMKDVPECEAMYADEDAIMHRLSLDTGHDLQDAKIKLDDLKSYFASLVDTCAEPSRPTHITPPPDFPGF